MGGRGHRVEVATGDPVTIVVKSVDAGRVADLSRDTPLADQVLDLLRGGALGRADIAGELGKTPGHVGKELTALSQRGKVIQVARGEWGLSAQ